MVIMEIVAPMDMKKDTLLEVEVAGNPCSFPCPRDVKMGETIAGTTKATICSITSLKVRCLNPTSL
jgi:hypothetical protein